MNEYARNAGSRSRARRALLYLAILIGLQVPVAASDHADPMVLKEPDANITDLFFFPDGDRYVVIFDVRRSLTALPPYTLENYEYRINFDLHTPIGFENEEMTARYGGTINATTIKEDRSIRIQLKNDGMSSAVTYDRFADTSGILTRTGVFDDPFIFPRFFKKNTVATIISIPKTAFPPDQTHFVLWGATFKDGKQIDHVGRSNRTQQARFEPLNTLHPSQHLNAIMKRQRLDGLVRWLNGFRQTQPIAGGLQILLQIRKYDRVPDVMVYSTQFPQDIYSTYFPNELPGGFPNGRGLKDDVAARTCAVGDCILQELSFVEGEWPRARENDKPLLDTFPYLAAPWREGDKGFEASKPLRSIWRSWVSLVVILLIAVFVWLIYYAVLGWKYKRLRRRQHADAVL